jgi:maltooligosyltrehalose trehalohydrolase
MRLGAKYETDGKCHFTVWAPLKERMVLHMVAPHERLVEMQRDQYGYFTATLNNISPETRYFYRPDDKKDFPDPLSLFQPEGVHGPSQVTDHASFKWTDTDWKNIPFEDLILYEIHTGTFTKQGSFDAIIPLLDDLKDVGINAIELMPVAQFPGSRNWGYDGIYSYAVQNSYGGPEALKRLVNAAHQKGIAVFLDVVYNHLGPEGNYFGEFGPYFTKKYSTPWGEALNFDGEWSDGVRDYFTDNAIYWFEYFHIDGLRLDAIHTIFDMNAVTFFDLLHNKIKRFEKKAGRNFHLIAESDLNSPRVVKPADEGGFGFTAQWLDDFHHALYTLLDPAGKNRYQDYGSLDQLIKAYKEGFVLSGDWVKFRKRKFGTSSYGVPGNRFVVFNCNHDQIGNRVGGERLTMLVDTEKVKLAAAAILLSPYIPMLFMGEEYGDDTPFYYFVDHSDEELIKAVQEGRKKEFREYGFETAPPDPADIKTFESAKIKREKRNEGRYAEILDWHRRLIQLRRSHPSFKNFNKEDLSVEVNNSTFILHRKSADHQHMVICAFEFSGGQIKYDPPETFKLTLQSKLVAIYSSQ